jgi:hypothetical protein
MSEAQQEQSTFARPQEMVPSLESTLDDVEGVTAGAHFRRRMLLDDAHHHHELDAH